MNEIIQLTETLQFTLGESVLEIIYLIASILFVFGLKMLSQPDTARKGNLWAAFGMLIAIIGTILFYKSGDGEGVKNVLLIIVAMIIGTVIGWLIAKKVDMKAMPQLVSLFNGMGGACIAVIGVMEYTNIDATAGLHFGEFISIILGMVIGSVAFTGSMIAFGKLNGNIGDVRAPVLRYINLLFVLAIVVLIIYDLANPTVMASGSLDTTMLYILFALALVYGITFVMPIGGADMPVVISLLNSFTGLAAAFGGFLYHNQAILTGGILVGSAAAELLQQKA